MNSCLENIVDYFKPFLLSDIIIKTDKKNLKKGKLKIFQIKQHYIRLFLEIDDKTKMYEIPYPYKIHHNDAGGLTLNYHLSSIFQNVELQTRVKFLDKSNKSKIYDNNVYVLNNTKETL